MKCTIRSLYFFFIFLTKKKRIGAAFSGKGSSSKGEYREAGGKLREPSFNETWGGENAWRIGHRILGALIVALGLTNISLGVFLAVLPLAVWIIWFIYMGFLVLILFGMELVALFRNNDQGSMHSGSYRPAGRTN